MSHHVDALVNFREVQFVYKIKKKQTNYNSVYRVFSNVGYCYKCLFVGSMKIFLLKCIRKREAMTTNIKSLALIESSKSYKRNKLSGCSSNHSDVRSI